MATRSTRSNSTHAASGDIPAHWPSLPSFLRAALAAAPEASAPARCRALYFASNLALEHGSFDAAERLAHEELALARDHADRKEAGRALCVLGTLAWYRGDLTSAAELLEDSLTEASAAADGWGRRVVLVNLAAVAAAIGSHARAFALEREMVASARERHDDGVLASALNNLGNHLAERGETEEARRTLEEAIALTRSRGLLALRVTALANLGALERTARPAVAVEHFREALILLRESGAPRGTAYVLEGIAGAVLARSDPARAARLLAAAAAIRERTGSAANSHEQADVDTTTAEARAALGEDAFDAAVAEGGVLSLEQAIDLGLEVTAPH